MTRFFLLLAVILGLVTPAQAQVVPVTSADTLTYEVFARGGDVAGTFQTPVLQAVNMKNVGQFQSYGSGTTVRMFDPYTLAATSSMLASESNTFTPSTNRTTNMDFTPGTSWKVKFSRPPTIGSPCINVSADLTITVTSAGTTSVLINGQPTEVKTITASQKGWWSAGGCRASGETKGEIVYSPDLGAALSIESTFFYQNFPSGEKIVLSEIRRGK